MKTCGVLNSGIKLLFAVLFILTLINNSDCWPVFDKKQEQQFRKNCSEWIARISKVCVLLGQIV